MSSCFVQKITLHHGSYARLSIDWAGAYRNGRVKSNKRDKVDQSRASIFIQPDPKAKTMIIWAQRLTSLQQDSLQQDYKLINSPVVTTRENLLESGYIVQTRIQCLGVSISRKVASQPGTGHSRLITIMRQIGEGKSQETTRRLSSQRVSGILMLLLGLHMQFQFYSYSETGAIANQSIRASSLVLACWMVWCV